MEENTQRLKLLYIYKMLFEETNDDNPMTLAQISERLAEYGINAHRKALYADIKALRDFGVDIISIKSSNYGYYIGERIFELPELKLLSDAVCSARFLTKKKTDELLRKIESLAGKHNAQLIHNQLFASEKIKSLNERIYLNIDAIQRAISEKKQISFKYFDYSTDKQFVYRDGDRIASPYALIWDDEKYYLIAYYLKYPSTYTNFRVDRMTSVSVLNKPAEQSPQELDLSEYLTSIFSMFSGNTTDAMLEFDNSLINVVIDHFGTNVPIIESNEKCFTIDVKVKPETTFFSWLFQFGNKVRIISPEELKTAYAKQLKQAFSALENNTIQEESHNEV